MPLLLVAKDLQHNNFLSFPGMGSGKLKMTARSSQAEHHKINKSTYYHEIQEDAAAQGSPSAAVGLAAAGCVGA